MLHMRPTVALLVALLTPGCYAQTEATPDACPAVECGWETDTTTCRSEANAYSTQTRYEEPDALTACWIHEAVCVPKGTRAECVPDACRRTFADCQPMGDARIGRP
jgi:hypothetical protein